MDNLWQKNDGTENGGSGAQSIAQMIAETANSFIETELLPGFTYVPEQDLYYNATTGYYHDMKTSLYYHPSTGWLSYNVLTGEYEVCGGKKSYDHNAYKAYWKLKKYRLKAIRQFGRDHVKQMNQEDVDVCEFLFDLVDRVTFLNGEKQSKKFVELGQYDDELHEYVRDLEEKGCSSEEEDEDRFASANDEYFRRMTEEESNSYPPCVRLIDKTNYNKLYIITIDGAKIGWSSKCEICLELNDSIAETHAKIRFIDEKNDKHYEIECVEKRYGVYLNDRKITTKRSTRLEHRSSLSIGPYQFEVHIHKGSNTCGDCEPGILNAKMNAAVEAKKLTQYERRQSHRQAMKSVKEKLGLNEIIEDSSPTKKYYDRAAKRRRTKGSEPNYPDSSNAYSGCKANPVPGASTDSVHFHSATSAGTLNPENKGFKMLKNMGWQENTGLGRERQGIVAPIESVLKSDKKGLGSEQQPQVSAKEQFRLKVLAKTRDRFNEV